MKLKIFLVMCALCFVHSSLVAAGESLEEKQTISTQGEAKIWIEPDRARLFFGIETMAQTMEAARDQNAVKIQKVMKVLEALKIKDMLIKAPSYNVSLVKEKEYNATKQGRLPKIIGYKVVQNFTVLLKGKDTLKLSKNASLVIDAALSKGVNIVENVQFFKENDSEDRRKVLELAVQDAILNAKTIAKSAGLSIKKYIMINSTTRYWEPRRFSQMHQSLSAEAVGGVPTTLVAGKVAISANVQIRCLVE